MLLVRDFWTHRWKTPWYKICTFSLYAQLCRDISKMGNKVVTLQCILPYILWKMTHDLFGLMWFLPININEDNASKFLFNAFMKTCSLSGKPFIQGSCLKTLMISEEKLWTCLGVCYEMVPCRTAENPTFNTEASSNQRSLALLHSGYRTWGNSFIFLNTYFLICEMGVPFLFC